MFKARARLRLLGDASPGPQHNHVPPRLAPLTDAVRDQITANPDAKLRKVRAWLGQAVVGLFSITTLHALSCNV